MIISNHSLRNESLRARNKVAHVELLRGLARPVLWPIETNNTDKKKILSSEKKRAKLKTKKHNDDFRKVVISN